MPAPFADCFEDLDAMDGPHIGIAQRIGKVDRERNAQSCGVIRSVRLGSRHATHEGEFIAVALDGIAQDSSPPIQSNYGTFKHDVRLIVSWLSRLSIGPTASAILLSTRLYPVGEARRQIRLFE